MLGFADTDVINNAFKLATFRLYLYSRIIMEDTPPPFEKDTYMRDFKYINFALKVYFEQHVTGLENIPDEPALYLVNHLKFVDSPLVAATYTMHTGKQLRFLAQDGYFKGEGLRKKNGKRILGPHIERIVKNTHMISVDRSGSHAGLRQLTTDVNETFQREESAAGHPESTRADNGKVNRFYPTVTRIGMDAGVPIVPVGISYYESSSLHPLAVDVNFGKAFTNLDYEHGLLMALPKGKRVDRVNSLLRNSVAKLARMELGSEYMQDIRDRKEAEAKELYEAKMREQEQ